MKAVYTNAALFFCLFIWPPAVIAQGQDLTRTPGSSGTPVVLATVALIRESGIFPDDRQLLRRLAWVESRDGTDSRTYRQGYYGGIWQVDLIAFQDTQNTTSRSGLVSTFREIQRQFNIDWPSVQWEDLHRPLYSGLAARLILLNVAESIPLASDVAGQASYWRRHYNTAGDEARFIADVAALQEECQTRGIDLIFILDSSGSVGASNFQNVRDFVANLVSQLEIGPDSTRVGLINFASSATVQFSLNTHQDSSSLLQAIAIVPFTGGGTNTAAALTTLLSEFSTVNGARPLQEGIPRVTIVVTDGQSNNPTATIVAANNVHASNIIAFAVGVGSNIPIVELNAIASDPDSRFVRLLSTFNADELRDLQELLSSEACQTPAIGEKGVPFISTLDQNQAAFFQYTLPDEGLTLTFEVETGLIVCFASNRIQNPNEALHDFRVETSSFADVFISQEANSSTTIFISCEGQNGINSFTLNTTCGDTTTVDCIEPGGPCDENAICEELPGSNNFACTCMPMFVGDGFMCQPRRMIGDDPHFSIVLPDGTSLCYTVQGEQGFVFSLISNKMLHMNAMFVPDSRREEVTWLGSIGIVVHNNIYKTSNATYLRFEAKGKKIYIGDKVVLEAKNIEKLSFNNGKLTISEAPPVEGFKNPSVEIDLLNVGLHFAIKFMNEHLDLFWHCTGHETKDSHGLIGQFFRKGVEVDTVRKILILPGKEPVPVMRRPVWSFMEREVADNQLCWTAMNPGYQGVGLIDGTYLDYLMNDVLSTNFKFKKQPQTKLAFH